MKILWEYHIIMDLRVFLYQDLHQQDLILLNTMYIKIKNKCENQMLKNY